MADKGDAKSGVANRLTFTAPFESRVLDLSIPRTLTTLESCDQLIGTPSIWPPGFPSGVIEIVAVYVGLPIDWRKYKTLAKNGVTYSTDYLQVVTAPRGFENMHVVAEACSWVEQENDVS